MYDAILVPVDGSESAEEAATRAFTVASATGATVHVLYVIETTDLEPLSPDETASYRSMAESHGREALSAVADRAADAPFDVEIVREVREGVPYREITDLVDAAGIDLVVMGTRGLATAQRTRAGSTTERVISFTDVPVIAVPAGASAWTGDDPVGPKRVLVPTDGSDVAERAATHALDLATYSRATVDVLYVIDEAIHALGDAPRSIIGLLKEGGREAVEAVAADARDRELSVTNEVVSGVPEQEVLSYATGVDADLIAMGTRGRTGATGTDRIIGSTTARVLERADRPVLVLD